MQILSAEQIREWDRYTIEHEPVSSVDLMERAAKACLQWIVKQPWEGKTFLVFCGKGNNGGDGLVLARMLIQKGCRVSIYILEFGKLGSADFQVNLQRLHDIPATDLHFIQAAEQFPLIPTQAIVIDALFGSGLNKPLEGLAASLVSHLNESGAVVVSIDLPSGLFIDRSSGHHPVIKAHYTLSFQCYKLGLLVQENASFIGNVRILDIGLHKDYLTRVNTPYTLSDEKMIRKLFRPRKRFAHKGTFGHALLVAGSYGKMGAAVLATKACLHAGAGLTTALIPKSGYSILQISAPEAMCLVDENEFSVTQLPDDIERYTSIGIGPGIGTAAETQKLLSFLIRRFGRPLVIDADGLNCLALNREWLGGLPPYSILTPHPKEFDRLFGDHTDDFERLHTAQDKATEYNIIIVLKGQHTLVAEPGGRCYFNSTGNAGMAKGGSGDVLTGILTALLAQGYTPLEAALLGVYIHGWAGDLAARKYSKETMLPSQVTECLAEVFLLLQH